jgi:hypothetical protein
MNGYGDLRLCRSGIRCLFLELYNKGFLIRPWGRPFRRRMSHTHGNSGARAERAAI